MSEITMQQVKCGNGSTVALAKAPGDWEGPGDWLIYLSNAEGSETKLQLSDDALVALKVLIDREAESKWRLAQRAMKKWIAAETTPPQDDAS